MLFGQVKGYVPVVVRGVVKNLKGLLPFRKLAKVEAYRTSKLNPRLSDPDFMPHETFLEVEDTCMQAFLPLDQLITLRAECSNDANAVTTFIVGSQIASAPIMAVSNAAAALNSTMMQLFQSLGSRGGFFKDQKTAGILLVTAAATEVLVHIPESWDACIDLLDRAIANNMLEHLLDDPTFKSLHELSLQQYSLLRFGGFCFCTS